MGRRPQRCRHQKKYESSGYHSHRQHAGLRIHKSCRPDRSGKPSTREAPSGCIRSRDHAPAIPRSNKVVLLDMEIHIMLGWLRLRLRCSTICLSELKLKTPLHMHNNPRVL
jgi:hypothetical protein